MLHRIRNCLTFEISNVKIISHKFVSQVTFICHEIINYSIPW